LPVRVKALFFLPMPDFFTLPSYRFLKLPNQAEVAYLDEGPKESPVILFLHGLGDLAQIWANTINALKAKYRCVAIDLPGHGQTNIPGFSFRMFDFGEFILKFLEQLNIKNFVLAGHSMGGQIGIILTLRMPALVEKLILVAPAGFEVFTEAEKIILKAGLTQANNWKQATGNVAVKEIPPRQIGLQRCMANMLAEPIFDFLPQLNLPVLVIFGENDGFIPNRFLHAQTTAQIARAGASEIPNAELHIFSRCGHYPQNEKPKEFNEVTGNFLRF
jgi:pimeloyl-ACP methyl ester carboxylesterase